MSPCLKGRQRPECLIFLAHPRESLTVEYQSPYLRVTQSYMDTNNRDCSSTKSGLIGFLMMSHIKLLSDDAGGYESDGVKNG